MLRGVRRLATTFPKIPRCRFEQVWIILESPQSSVTRWAKNSALVFGRVAVIDSHSWLVLIADVALPFPHVGLVLRPCQAGPSGRSAPTALYLARFALGAVPEAAVGKFVEASFSRQQLVALGALPQSSHITPRV